MPTPDLPVHCCCYSCCRSPIPCKALGKDKRWALAQGSWNLAYPGPCSNTLTSDQKAATPSKVWLDCRRGIRLWSWAGCYRFGYQNDVMFTADIIWSSYRSFLVPIRCSQGEASHLLTQYVKISKSFLLSCFTRNRTRLALGIYWRERLCHGQDVSFPVRSLAG